MDSPRPEAASSTPRVLVVDDERPLAQMVGSYLIRAGYTVSEAYTGPDAVSLARELDPDVIVLDLGLPGLDGIEVCRQVRTFSDCYVLMLTARATRWTASSASRSVPTTTSPSPSAPASSSLASRRCSVARAGRRAAGGVDGPAEEPPGLWRAVRRPGGRSVSVGGQPADLTRTEFDILDVLSARPRYAFSRRQLIDEVWDIAWVGDEHIVDVHVGHIRRKLGDDPAAPRYIETVRGIGYRMGRG